MRPPEEYRRKAKSCLDQANATQDRDLKESLQDVANSWRRLAATDPAYVMAGSGMPSASCGPNIRSAAPGSGRGAFFILSRFVQCPVAMAASRSGSAGGALPRHATCRSGRSSSRSQP